MPEPLLPEIDQPSTPAQANQLLRTWKTINAIPADATDEEIDAWLMEPTERSCPYCRTQYLRRCESLNNRCESCRAKLAAIIERPEELARRLRETGIPAKYLVMTLATWRGGMGQELDAFRRRPTGQLFLHGPRQQGKTHAATAVLRKLSDDGLSVFWADAGEAIRRIVTIRDLWFEDRMRDCSVLLIDDFGKAPDGGVLERVIRFRDMGERPTLITSNLGRRPDGKHDMEIHNPSLWARLKEVEF